MEKGKIFINYEEENFKSWQMSKYILSAILMVALIYCMGLLANAQTLHPVEKLDITKVPNKVNKINPGIKYKTANASEIPAVVDLTSKMPPVGNQQQKGSCVGWAFGRYMQSFYQAKDFGWDIKSSSNWNSPDFIYSLRSNYGPGMYMYEALDILRNQGCCYESYMPYNPDENVYIYPSDAAFRNALNYKAQTTNIIANDGSDATVNWLREYISKGNTAAIAIPVSYDFDSLNSYNPIYDTYDNYTFRGYHAICIIGYDDTKQAFKFINSWGTAWGLSGYGYISYNLFNSSDFQCEPFVMSDQDTGHKIKFYDWSQTNTKVGSNYKFSIYFTSIKKTLTTKGQSIYTTSHSYQIKARIYENDSMPDYSAYIYKTLVPGWNSIKFTVKENSGRYKGQTSVVTVRIYIYN